MSDLKLYTTYNKIYSVPPPHTSYGEYILIKGFDFSTVSAVKIDGVLTTEFELTTKHSIKVKGLSNSEVEVLTSGYVEDSESNIIFGMTPDRIQLTSSGLETLKQRVIKALISDPQSDAFSGLGAGLDKLAGSAVTSSIVTNAISRIRQVEDSLLSTESVDEPLESALGRINILGAEEDSSYNTRILIQIVNKAGQSTETEVSSD